MFALPPTFRLCAAMQNQVIEFLPLLLPVLVSRLGSEEVTEPSEELRLQLLQLLSAVVKACAAEMAPYLDDMILILQRTIVDPYPELKKVSERDILWSAVQYDRYACTCTCVQCHTVYTQVGEELFSNDDIVGEE